MKRLYKFFMEKRRLAEIVAEEGFDPEVVQIEHERFLQFEGLDPHSMQEMILNRVVLLIPAGRWNRKGTFDMYKDRFDKYHYLNDRQFEHVISMLESLSRRAGLNSVRDPSMRAPDGWARPICAKCGRPLSGLVFDPAGPWGIEIEELQKDWYHEFCERER